MNQRFSFFDADILRKVTVLFGLPFKQVTMLYNIVQNQPNPKISGNSHVLTHIRASSKRRNLESPVSHSCYTMKKEDSLGLLRETKSNT